MSDERLRARFKDRPVELDEVLLGILHRLDDGTSERKAAYDRLEAIEEKMKKRAPRGGFARYLVAICIGVAATLAWQSYGEVLKQIIAAKAPGLGWSPEAKQMIATTKRAAGSESTAVQPSLPRQVVATVDQTVPAAVGQQVSAAPSIDPEQVHQIVVDLAALGQTVKQLTGSQDQMAHQIETLQTSIQEILASNREILDRIPRPPPPPPPAVAPVHKPTTRN